MIKLRKPAVQEYSPFLKPSQIVIGVPRWEQRGVVFHTKSSIFPFSHFDFLVAADAQSSTYTIIFQELFDTGAGILLKVEVLFVNAHWHLVRGARCLISRVLVSVLRTSSLITKTVGTCAANTRAFWTLSIAILLNFSCCSSQHSSPET